MILLAPGNGKALGRVHAHMHTANDTYVDGHHCALTMAGVPQGPVSGETKDTPEKPYSIFLDLSCGYLGVCFRNSLSCTFLAPELSALVPTDMAPERDALLPVHLSHKGPESQGLSSSSSLMSALAGSFSYY